MSAFLLGTGFRADMGTCIRKLVLLKLIDACEDDGSRIFPAIATVARAAQCSDRQVQREIKAFLDIGLLSLVRAGGQGRRSTNEYALDLDVLSAISKAGWDAYAAENGLNPKGDTQSPLDEDAKGDKTGPDRVTPETPKGDNGSPPTPPDPSLDPSIEREREREPEDRKTVERWLKRVHPNWPTFVADSGATALREALALTAEEREAAASRMADYLAAERAHGGRCAFSIYLAEKRWERLPAPQAEPAKPAYAPAFGPVWAAIRMRALLGGPTHHVPLKAWELAAIDNGTLDRATLEKGNRMRGGWPAVNFMHAQAAERGGGVSVRSEIDEQLGKLCEAVPVGSETFEAWKLEHELRGWPWLPDPGRQPVVYFPAGGPGALSAFEQAVKQGNEGNTDDGGQRQAAE